MVEAKLNSLIEFSCADVSCSDSKDDFKILDDTIAIIERITSDTKTSIIVKPLLFINKKSFRFI